MTWPLLPDSVVVARVLDTTVVFGQRSGMLVRVDDVGRFVLEHREQFADHTDAAQELTELLVADRDEVEADLRALEAALADLAVEDPSPIDPSVGRALGPPPGTEPAVWAIDALGVPVVVRGHSPRLVEVLAPLLAAHPRSAAMPAHRFDVWEEDEGITITRDDRLIYERAGIDDAVNGVIAGITIAAILAPRRNIALHAAAVADGPAAVMLGGGSGVGKSTTTVELTADGWTFLTDELVELDTSAGRITGLPRPIGLEGAARGWRQELLPPWSDAEHDLHRWPVPPTLIGDVGSTGQLGLIVHLEFDGADPARVQPIEPLEALGRLCGLTFNRDRLTAEVLAELGQLLTRVPSIVLHHGGAGGAARAVADHWRGLRRGCER